jgi:hypothetical protein
MFLLKTLSNAKKAIRRERVAKYLVLTLTVTLMNFGGPATYSASATSSSVSGVGVGNGLQMFLRTEAVATSAATSTPFNSNTCFVGNIANLDFSSFNAYTSCGNLSGANRENITAYIRGYILAPASETISFWSSNDDGLLVSINGTRVISNWVDTAPGAYGTFNSNSATNTFAMTQGRIYPIEIQYHQTGAGAQLKLYWSYPSCPGCSTKATAQLIPQNQLGTSSADLGTDCAIGMSEACPASSAMEIKDLTGTNTDGLYWITSAGVSTQVFSLMNSSLGGGGWQLAMKGQSSSSTFGYSSSYWTDTATLNSGSPSRIATSNSDAKYSTFHGTFANQMMALFPSYSGATYGGAYPSAGYGFAWSESITGMSAWTAYNGTTGFGGNSASTNMTSGPQGSGGCRTTPSTLRDMFTTSNRCAIRQVQPLASGTESYPNGSTASYYAAGSNLFATQKDIRFFGINYGNNSSGASTRARWGFGFNENGNGDENSNDVLGGIGLGGPSITAGTYMGCCSATGGGGQAGVSGNSNGSATNMAFELYVRETGVQISGSTELRTAAGSSASLTLSSTRSSGATSTTWNIPGLLTGLTLNTSTGFLTASASVAAGTYYETATAIDDTGARDTYPLKITITPTASETDTAISLSGSQFLAASNESAFDISSGTTFTLEAWVRPSVTNANQILLGKDLQYSLLISSNGSFGANFFTTNAPTGTGGETGIFGAASVRPNEWQHVALVRNGTTITGFINGQQVGSMTNGSATDSIRAGSSPFVIGGYSTSNQPYTGQIDQVRVWSSARSSAELQAGMNAFLPATQTNLIASYGFNESVGARIYNNSTAANWDTDLTLNGGSLAWAQIAETGTSGVYSTVTFNRTFLTSFGGWRPAFDSRTATVLAVGGGGGGGGAFTTSVTDGAGGGGGGGVFELSRYPLSNTSRYVVRVGTAGSGGTAGSAREGRQGFSGTTTTFESLTAGGGGAGGFLNSTNQDGLSGTAGGGGGGASNYWNAYENGAGGAGTNLTIAGTTYTGRTGGVGGVFPGPASSAGAGGGSGGAPTETTNSGVTTRFVGAGISSNLSGSSVTYGRGGGAFGVSGWSFSVRATIPGTGGDGVYNQSSDGGDGANGIIIIRWITATAPTFTAPVAVDTTTALTRYTFRAGGSATSPLIRNFQWQSSTDTGTTWTTVQASTSDSYTTGLLDLGTSGPRYRYRVIVTDSDTAGLSISDSSTAHLILNRYPTISPPASNDSGLLVHLDASQSASYPGSGSSWNDVSGNTRHASLGIVSGGPVIAGHGSGLTCSAPAFTATNGGAFAFSGDTTTTRNCAWIPNSRYTDVGETFTVEVWANPAIAAQTTWTALITTPWNTGNDKVNFAIGFNGSQTTAGVPDIWGGIFDGSNWYQTPITGLPINSWSHVSLTSSNRVLTLYVNGEAKQSVSLAGSNSISGTNKGVLIGRRWDGTQTYNGSIGTVRISNTALSAEQIRQNYYLSSNRFSNTASGVKSSSTTYATTLTETFTATNGTGTKRFTFTPNNRAGIVWDTSTANSAVLRVTSALNAGTYYETLTATDSATAATSLGLTITVNKARQASLSIGQYNAFVGTSTYPINVYGGSGTGAVTRSRLSAGSANCTLASEMFLTATSPGICSVQAVKAADTNYLSETATATIYWIQWSDAYATRVPSTPTEIVLNHSTAITKYNYDTLTVTSYQNSSGVTITSIATGATLRIIGDGFSPTSAYTEVVFASMDALDLTSGLQVISSGGSNYLQLTVPSGVTTGAITVNSPKGTSVGPTLTITP